MLIGFVVLVLAIGGGLAFFYLLAPRGTEVDGGEHTDFSAQERMGALVLAAALIAVSLFLRTVGLDENTHVGAVVVGIVGFPILFLVFIAAVGGVSRD